MDHFESLYWISFNIISVLCFGVLPWGIGRCSLNHWNTREIAWLLCLWFSVSFFPFHQESVYSCHAFLLAFFPLSSCRSESAQIFVVLGVGNFSMWSFSWLPPGCPVRVWRLLFLLMLLWPEDSEQPGRAELQQMAHRVRTWPEDVGLVAFAPGIF